MPTEADGRPPLEGEGPTIMDKLVSPNGLDERGPVPDMVNTAARTIATLRVKFINQWTPGADSPLTTREVGELFDAATLQAEWMRELYEAHDTLSAELAATREERDRLAGELWDMAGDRANLLGALTHIAQFDPRWKGQHINTAPSRAQLIAVAFDALDASQKED